jgi:hypothetical protein
MRMRKGDGGEVFSLISPFSHAHFGAGALLFFIDSSVGSQYHSHVA